MSPPSLLFVGHGAERSGPPVFLANFQRWLSGHTDVAFATVLTRGGTLVEDYRRWGPVRVLDARWSLPRIAQQGLGRAGLRGPAAAVQASRDRSHLRSWRRAPVTYVNTVSPATLRVLAHVDRSSLVIAHVHEMEAALRYRLDDQAHRLFRERPDRYLAASRAVAANLIENHAIPAERIEVQYEFVEPVTATGKGERPRLRRERGIPAEAFVVGASGMTEWRKGPDHFVRLAAELRRRTDRPLFFVWVGGAESGPEWWPLDHEAHHLDVDDIVHFVGHQDDPGSWYRLFDVFTSTSREDAFPLAALEAATAGVPVITFDTGGMVEFVTRCDGGVVVPYPDVSGFADALAALTDDDRRRAALGAAAAEGARAHHVTDVSAPGLAAFLADLTAGSDRSIAATDVTPDDPPAAGPKGPARAARRSNRRLPRPLG